jgi:hypothetical protein
MRALKIAAGLACGLAVGCGQTHEEQPSAVAEELTSVRIYPTVDQVQAARSGADTGILANRKPGGGGGSNLSYHGGVGGIGVETAPAVYIVYWGSQWNNNDPSGEAAIQQNFLNGVGGSSWNNSVTQYCQGVASGTIFCNGAGTAAGNPTGVLKGFWYDNASAAPSRPTQSQLAAEAVAAAAHFGNTAAGSNNSTQYVISTSTGNSQRLQQRRGRLRALVPVARRARGKAGSPASREAGQEAGRVISRAPAGMPTCRRSAPTGPAPPRCARAGCTWPCDRCAMPTRS